MATNKAILILGWSSAPPEASAAQAASAGTPEQLHERTMEGVKKAAEAGYDFTILYVSHTDLAGAESKLREALGRQKWDGFIIGNGVRGIAAYTSFFEMAVNMAREMAPDMRMGFNTEPNDLFETAVRNF